VYVANETIACANCGNIYAPATTASSTKDDHIGRDDLRSALGPEAFAKFAVKYLVGQGASEAEAEEIVREIEDWTSRQLDIAQQIDRQREQWPWSR